MFLFMFYSCQAFLVKRILIFVETKTDPVEKGIILVGIFELEVFCIIFYSRFFECLNVY